MVQVASHQKYRAEVGRVILRPVKYPKHGGLSLGSPGIYDEDEALSFLAEKFILGPSLARAVAVTGESYITIFSEAVSIRNMAWALFWKELESYAESKSRNYGADPWKLYIRAEPRIRKCAERFNQTDGTVVKFPKPRYAVRARFVLSDRPDVYDSLIA